MTKKAIIVISTLSALILILIGGLVVAGSSLGAFLAGSNWWPAESGPVTWRLEGPGGVSRGYANDKSAAKWALAAKKLEVPAWVQDPVPVATLRSAAPTPPPAPPLPPVTNWVTTVVTQRVEVTHWVNNTPVAAPTPIVINVAAGAKASATATNGTSVVTTNTVVTVQSPQPDPGEPPYWLRRLPGF